MTDEVPVLPAATILLVRDEPAFEVLMVQRHADIDFASGALVFPGGKVHAGDSDPRWIDRTIGWRDHVETKRALRIAAIREAYEESGILLARHVDGTPFGGDPAANAARDDIAHDRRPFLDLITELNLVLDLAALTPFARWITPPPSPKRFDTWFYLATTPAGQDAECDGWETVVAEWLAPDEAVRLALDGGRNIIFPTRMNLQLLAESASTDEAHARSAQRTVVPVQSERATRNGVDVLVIPADAGYGLVEEPVSRAWNTRR